MRVRSSARAHSKSPHWIAAGIALAAFSRVLAAQDPVFVDVAKTTPGPDSILVTSGAVIAPGATFVLTAPVDGQVGRVKVRPGQKVKALEELVFLSTPELVAEKSRTEARVNHAERRLDIAAMDVKLARLDQGEASAQLEAAKAEEEPFLGAMVAAERVLQAAKASEDPAAVAPAEAAVRQATRAARRMQTATAACERAIERALLRVVRADREVVAARSLVDARRAEKNAVLVRLNQATIKAPYEGLQVSRVLVQRGERVQAGSTPVVELIDTSRVRLTLTFNQEFATRMVLGMKAQIHTAGNDPRPASVIAIPPLPVRENIYEITLGAAAHPDLPLGRFGNASLRLPTPGVVRIPERALATGISVFVVRDGTVTRQKVTAFYTKSEGWLTWGIPADTQLVLDPGQDLKNGTPVEVR